MNSNEIINSIEATCLKMDCDIEEFYDKICKYGFKTYCLLPQHADSPFLIKKHWASYGSHNRVTVFNFPFGSSSAESVCIDINRYVAFDGADIVLPPLSGNINYNNFLRDISTSLSQLSKQQFGEYATTRFLERSKIIIESLLIEWNERIFKDTLNYIYLRGFGFIKTHTGFGPRGVNIDDIKRIRDVVGDSIKIKASGGIKSLDDLMKLKDAGADVFGIGIDSAIKIAEELGVKPCKD